MYDRIIDWCIENKITMEQYTVLHLLMAKKSRTIRLYAKRFPFKNGKFLTKVEKDDLVNRGFLIPANKGYKIGQTFLDLYANEYTSGNEIWAMYPGFVRKSDGTMIPLTSMSKQIFRHAYWKAIDKNQEEHKQVKLDLEYGIKHNLINFGIKKFIDAEYWTKLRELRLSSTTNLNNLSTVQTDDDF